MQHLAKAFALIGLILVTTVAVATTASATTPVTTAGYNADSTSGELHFSCKDLSISSKGALNGTCNYDDNGLVKTKSTSIDLESYVKCDNPNGNLVWGTGGFIESTSGEVIALNSTGSSYLLSATAQGNCRGGDQGDAVIQIISTLQLHERIGNSGGDFKYSYSSR